MSGANNTIRHPQDHCAHWVGPAIIAGSAGSSVTPVRAHLASPSNVHPPGELRGTTPAHHQCEDQPHADF